MCLLLLRRLKKFQELASQWELLARALLGTFRIWKSDSTCTNLVRTIIHLRSLRASAQNLRNKLRKSRDSSVSLLQCYSSAASFAFLKYTTFNHLFPGIIILNTPLSSCFIKKLSYLASFEEAFCDTLAAWYSPGLLDTGCDFQVKIVRSDALFGHQISVRNL